MRLYRIPLWALPLLLLFLSLVGLGVLALVWVLGALFLLGGGLYALASRLWSRARWRRLPALRK